MKINPTLGKKFVLDFIIALFICISPVRDFISRFTGHPALVMIVLIYGMLVLYFFVGKLRVKDIVSLILPVVVVAILVGMTWVLYPEQKRDSGVNERSRL